MKKIDVYEELRKPFPAKDIEWRVQQAGEKNGRVWAMVLAYVDARAIRRRLDEVVGFANWQTTYKTVGNGVCCELSVRESILDPDSEGLIWVTKSDGSGETDFEGVKGAFSGALKRAAYSWGIGQYLYDLEATFAIITDKGTHYQPPGKKHPAFKWDPPPLPAWALPEITNRVTNTQLNKLQNAVEALGADETAFLRYLGIYDWHNMTTDLLPKAEEALTAKEKANEKKSKVPVTPN